MRAALQRSSEANPNIAQAVELPRGWAALRRAGIHRQAALEPARPGRAAGRAFANVIDLRETLVLQVALHLSGTVAGAADQRNGRSVALHLLQQRAGEAGRPADAAC